MKFTIEKVVKLTGVSAATLRNWEKRYDFPCPERADSRHRFYSSEDIEFLKTVKELLSSGHNLTQIAGLYKEQRCDQQLQAKSMCYDLVDDVGYRVQLLYESLIGLNTNVALSHYTILNSKLSPEKFFDKVVEVILRKIKDDAALKKISVAQEHFASTFLRLRLMSFLCLDLPVAQSIKILAATMAEEKHEGRLLLISSHLKFRGYPIHYFGPDLPLVEMQELIRALKPQVLLLSYRDRQRFTEDLKLLQKMDLKICVGGAAFLDHHFFQKIQKKLPAHIRISTRAVGSEAASFIEMICQSR